MRNVFSFLNRFIFIMALADFIVVLAFDLVSPILAIYFNQRIVGGTLEVIGFGATVFFIATAIFKLPIAKIIDANMAEYDDYYATLFGYLIVSSIPFLYLLISKPIHFYLVQALYGFGTAMAYPGWMALFTRHIIKGREGISWGFYATIANVGAAAGSAVGGIIAYRVGFDILFILVGTTSIIGTLCLLFVRKDIITKGHLKEPIRPGKKINHQHPII